MKSKFVAVTILALASLSSAGAFAQTVQNRLEGEAAVAVRFEPSSSNLTRAQVNADYLQARLNGQVAASNEGAIAFTPAANSDVTRAEVRAKAVIWAKAHQADGGNAG
jgi:hypothetical protein